MTGPWCWVLVAVALALPGPTTPRRRRAGRGRTQPASGVPLVLDLAAAALSAGRTVPDALESAAGAGDPQVAIAVRRIARMLRLGAAPEQAWADAERIPALRTVVPIAVRSSTSGLRLAAALERAAAEVRAAESAAAAARAHRAGVMAVLPLAACFLPSFACLGIVPTVVGVAQAALGRPP